jgi:hypothetical protein
MHAPSGAPVIRGACSWQYFDVAGGLELTPFPFPFLMGCMLPTGCCCNCAGHQRQAVQASRS